MTDRPLVRLVKYPAYAKSSPSYPTFLIWKSGQSLMVANLNGYPVFSLVLIIITRLYSCPQLPSTSPFFHNPWIPTLAVSSPIRIRKKNYLLIKSCSITFGVSQLPPVRIYIRISQCRNFSKTSGFLFSSQAQIDLSSSPHMPLSPCYRLLSCYCLSAHGACILCFSVSSA